MAPLTHHAGDMAHENDPNAILNECRDIDSGINTVEENLEQLRQIQQRTLDDADSSSSSQANRQLDNLSTDTMSLYRSLTERVRMVKSNPESNSPKNKAQVSRVDRRLKAAITQYQQVESQFRKRTQDQMARQYRIVRPDATEDEVRAAVEDTSGGQVFSQALMQSDRQGRARAALSAVQDRHAALVKIEQQMVELAQLFQDMDTLVVQQEVAVMQIEQKGEEVVENLDKGNEEIGVAVNTARKTRKKKWLCLGICGMSSSGLLNCAHADLTSCHHRRHCHHCPHLHLRRQGQQQQEAKHRHRQRQRHQDHCRSPRTQPRRGPGQIHSRANASPSNRTAMNVGRAPSLSQHPEKWMTKPSNLMAFLCWNTCAGGKGTELEKVRYRLHRRKGEMKEGKHTHTHTTPGGLRGPPLPIA